MANKQSVEPHNLAREIKFNILKEMFRCHDSQDRSRLREFVDNLDAQIKELREEEARDTWYNDRRAEQEEFEREEPEQEKKDRESVL